MTKFEFPEMSPRIFRPAPMVELEVGAADATGAGAKVGAVAAGAAAAGDATAAGGAAGVVAVAGAGVSGVLRDEIAD